MDEELQKEQPDSFLRTIVSDFFKAQSAEYELRVQLCTDLEKMPVEDGSIQWSEAESPDIPVAKITIEQQNTASPARRVFGDGTLSYNPFHCLPEHHSLGNIMRIRHKVYERSTSYRHTTNMIPRREPV